MVAHSGHSIVLRRDERPMTRPMATPIASQTPMLPAITPATAPSAAPSAIPSPAYFGLLVITHSTDFPSASLRPRDGRRRPSPHKPTRASPDPSLGFRQLWRLGRLVADLAHLAQQL